MNKVTGLVLEVLPNNQYKVQLDGTDDIVRCYQCGKMRINKIGILPGDKVDLELPPNLSIQNSIGRIIYRK